MKYFPWKIIFLNVALSMIVLKQDKDYGLKNDENIYFYALYIIYLEFLFFIRLLGVFTNKFIQNGRIFIPYLSQLPFLNE